MAQRCRTGRHLRAQRTAMDGGFCRPWTESMGKVGPCSCPPFGGYVATLPASILGEHDQSGYKRGSGTTLEGASARSDRI